MLIDGRYLPDGMTLECDVAVVGAGPAGLTLARELAAAGIHVTVLEAGGRSHARSDDRTLQGRNIGAPLPTVTSRQRGFGGTSGHWTPETGLRVRELDVADLGPLEVRPQRWPFDRTELDPAYRRARQQVSLDASTPPGLPPGGLDTPLSWPGGPELAMFQFAEHDVFVRRFDEVAASAHIEVVLHSTVHEIELDPSGGDVRRLAVRCPDGNRFEVQPRFVVLAAGALENARLLLSSPGATGAGVGNEHDQVGRYFMDHLSIDCGTLEPVGDAPIDTSPFEETIAGSVPKFQAMLWLGDEVVRREGLLNAAFWVFDADRSYLSPGVSALRSLRASLRTRPVRGVVANAGRAVRHVGDIGAFALSRTTGIRHPQVGLRIMAEQAPDRDSRVTLGRSTDPMGMRRLQIDWRIGRLDLDSMRRHRDLLGELLAGRGVARVVGPFDPGSGARPLMSNFHHLGTTRMDDDPREGVVDATSRVHSVDNLYVTGGSVFPTGGYLNPTLTIIALSLRLADELRGRLGRAGDG